MLTNPITTTHLNKIIDQPPVSSMVVGGYKNADAVNPRGGYQKPFAITAQIFDHKNVHYVRPNRVVLKYPNFNKIC
jgi:hypothetical protein